VVRILIVAAMIAAALVTVRQQHVLQNAGLIGYCEEVPTPVRQTGVWHECRPGKLTGTPGLSLASCARISRGPDRDLWRCLTPLESNHARQ
jgi:hypothetical protein